MADADGTAAFEPHRPRLFRLAYRMLGSVADAQDAVQEAWLRWQAADRAVVANAGAFLARTVTRLCLDQLKSAQARRETYVGPWLPEPLIEAAGTADQAAGEAGLDLSVTLMLALERLSPLERAAFLLHDVFDASFEEVAAAIGRTPVACRQMAARARRHVREARPRFAVASDEGERIARAFHQATVSGDAGTLARILAEGVVLTSDGGGKVLALLNPIAGRDKVQRFFLSVAEKIAGHGLGSPAMRMRWINGSPGLVQRWPDGTLQTTTLDVAEGRIVAIHIVRNPDKLRHIEPPT